MNRGILTKFYSAVAALAAACALSVSCGEPEPPVTPDPPQTDPQMEAKNYLRKEYMNFYYYWADDVRERNSKVSAANVDIYDFFDKLLYGNDRWSWMCDKEYYVDSETGVVTGTYGASLSQPIEYYDDYGVYVRYVYPDSPFANNGVTRGWLLTHIAGTEVMDLIRQGTFESSLNTSPQTFTFNDVQGKPHTFTTDWATSLNVRSSLAVKIFTDKDFPGLKEPVGYFNYLSFKANFLDDISSAMETLRTAGVKTLILDLRYNGGGDSRASQLLVNYLAPQTAKGQIYVKRVHNAYLSSNDAAEKVGDAVTDPTTNKQVTGSSIGIEHLYIITGAGSASASEMVTNGLRPLMDVKMVGDTTYGKPNGMYVLFYPGEDADYARYNKDDYSKLQWVFLPICFYNKNGRNESIPDDGFIPDNYRPDDLYHDFDATEDNIKACLTHIVSGNYPELPATKAVRTKSASGRRKAAIAEEEKDPHYGTYTVNPKAHIR